METRKIEFTMSYPKEDLPATQTEMHVDKGVYLNECLTAIRYLANFCRKLFSESEGNTAKEDELNDLIVQVAVP
jgi:hypothetical protein